MCADAEVYLVEGYSACDDHGYREHEVLYNGTDKKCALGIAYSGYDRTVNFSVYREGKLVSEYYRHFWDKYGLEKTQDKWERTYGQKLEQDFPDGIH